MKVPCLLLHRKPDERRIYVEPDDVSSVRETGSGHAEVTVDGNRWIVKESALEVMRDIEKLQNVRDAVDTITEATEYLLDEIPNSEEWGDIVDKIEQDYKET